MDILIFSKDRAFQLHTSLETIKKYVSGINNIYVQFNYSNKAYLEGYLKLNNIFKDVIFIDETLYGFQNTLTVLLRDEVQSSNVMLEVDDTIYFKYLNLDKCNDLFSKEPDAGKYCFGIDPSIFNKKWFKDNNTHLSINKDNIITPPLQDLSLKYSFNASSVIHRKKDILNLLGLYNINTPIELEIEGSKSSIFTNYKLNLFNKEEVVKQIHTNNSLNRYEEIYSVLYLNNLILNNEVIDIDKIKVESFSTDMRWFNGEKIGRFPIFPWEIPPIHHKEIINTRKKL